MIFGRPCLFFIIKQFNKLQSIIRIEKIWKQKRPNLFDFIVLWLKTYSSQVDILQTSVNVLFMYHLSLSFQIALGPNSQWKLVLQQKEKNILMNYVPSYLLQLGLENLVQVYFISKFLIPFLILNSKIRCYQTHFQTICQKTHIHIIWNLYEAARYINIF